MSRRRRSRKTNWGWLAFFPVLTMLVLLSQCGHSTKPKETPQNVETMVMLLMSQTPTPTITPIPTDTPVPTATPYLTKTPVPEAACHDISCGCVIKGNINSEGKKIYHCPNSPNYNEVEINKIGERYFCTEQEAKDAGFELTSNTKYCGF